VIDDSNLPRNIWRHYLRTLDAFRVLELALREPVVSDQVRPDSPFFGLTQAELPDVLRDMSREVGLESSLALLASFEAILRVDYLARARQTLAGAPIDGRLRRLWSKFAERLPLEDLLDAWRDETQADSNFVGRFKQLLRFRDWLAHGRYWLPKGFAEFDAHTVVRVTSALERAIPGLPTLIDW
jgi:hypothetical protein